MKTILRSFIVTLLASIAVYGAETNNQSVEKIETYQVEQVTNYEFLPSIKVAAYLPTDSTYQGIYSNAPIYTFEFSAKVWKGLAPFASVSYLYNSGQLIGANVSPNSTKLYMVPIGVGLKYFLKVGNFQPYLGVGVLASYNRITNTYPFIPSPQSRWAAGGVFKLGALADLASNVFLDLFLDYNLIRVNFENNTSKYVQLNRADLSGFALGAGLGMRF